MSRDGLLPPGCTQRECDMAQPGYWDDEPEPREEEWGYWHGVHDAHSALFAEVQRLCDELAALPYDGWWAVLMLPWSIPRSRRLLAEIKALERVSTAMPKPPK